MSRFTETDVAMAKRDPRRGLGELAMQTSSWLSFDVLWIEMRMGADEEAQAGSMRLQSMHAYAFCAVL